MQAIVKFEQAFLEFLSSLEAISQIFSVKSAYDGKDAAIIRHLSTNLIHGNS